MNKSLRRLAFIILVISNVYCYAQEGTKRRLGIGDRVPLFEFQKVIYSSDSNLNISNFKGKAVLLNFWAPWCAPCIEGFKKLSSIKSRFGDSVVVLAITKENKQYVEKSLKQFIETDSLTGVNIIVEDSIAHKVFKPRVVPHYVWVDRNGVIKAISEQKDVTEENIKKLIEGSELEIAVKRNSNKYDFLRPLFAGNQIEDNSELVYQSIFAKYNQHLQATTVIRNNWILCTNHPIATLFIIAFGEGNLAYFSEDRMVLEGFNQMDSIRFGRYTRQNRHLWREIRRDYIYNYELFAQDSAFTAKGLFKIMQGDLNNFFSVKGYFGRIEERDIEKLVLVRSGKKVTTSSKKKEPKAEVSRYYLHIENQPISIFISNMRPYLLNNGSAMLFDETGIKDNLDIDLNCDLSNITAVNSELEAYGLRIEKRNERANVIVVSKRQDNKLVTIHQLD